MQDLLVPAETQAAIAADIARRTAEHQDAMARLRAADAHGAALGFDLGRKHPRVLLATGDSWFDYPLTGNGLPIEHTDIVAQLKVLGDNPPIILNLAHAGDATTAAMSLPKQQRMIKALLDGRNWPASGKPDAILFSGGGDDIAGNQFCIFLDYAAPGVSGLNAVRFDKMLGMVEACYLDLFAFRDRYATGVPIIAHSYDFPVPNGKHPICAGPWLKPSFDFCNWTVGDGTAIVKTALVAFREMLERLAADPHNNFSLVATQGLLKPKDWANELHPYPAGFVSFAKAFRKAF